jgi:hypothetical protein
MADCSARSDSQALQGTAPAPLSVPASVPVPGKRSKHMQERGTFFSSLLLARSLQVAGRSVVRRRIRSIRYVCTYKTIHTGWPPTENTVSVYWLARPWGGRKKYLKMFFDRFAIGSISFFLGAMPTISVVASAARRSRGAGPRTTWNVLAQAQARQAQPLPAPVLLSRPTRLPCAWG